MMHKADHHPRASRQPVSARDMLGSFRRAPRFNKFVESDEIRIRKSVIGTTNSRTKLTISISG